jgi:hypothetical protein
VLSASLMPQEAAAITTDAFMDVDSLVTTAVARL